MVLSRILTHLSNSHWTLALDRPGDWSRLTLHHFWPSMKQDGTFPQCSMWPSLCDSFGITVLHPSSSKSNQEFQLRFEYLLLSKAQQRVEGITWVPSCFFLPCLVLSSQLVKCVRAEMSHQSAFIATYRSVVAGHTSPVQLASSSSTNLLHDRTYACRLTYIIMLVQYNITILQSCCWIFWQINAF